MKLSELASSYNLDSGLLKEVVEVDLKIRLAKGMDTVMQEADVKRILACDGLETADGKPFTPIIAKEFEDKHQKKLATKKGLETRNKKKAEEDAKKKAEEDAKIEAERKKHEEALARREAERLAREQAEAEHERLRAEREALISTEAERLRMEAEADMRRRAEESQRIASELAAMRQAQAPAKPAPQAKPEPVAPVVAEAPAVQAPVETAPVAQAPAAQPVVAQPVAEAPAIQPTASAPVVAAAAAPVADAVVTLFESTAKPVEAKPVEAKPAPAPVAPKIGGIGSKLATLAKATHEKADRSIKAVPKPPEPVAMPAGKPDEALSPEDRKRLIQENIRKNLAMAQKVKDAKLADKRKRPGFATIDRTKTPGGPPGPNRGPGGPNRGPAGAPGANRGPGTGTAGPGRPGGPGGRGRGRNDRRDETDADGNPIKPGSRRRPLSTEETDLSGKTEFAVSLPCTVRELSEASGIKASTVIAKLFMAGVVANINSVVEKEAVELLALEFKKTVTFKEAADVLEQHEEEQAQAIAEDKPEDLAPRPPIVTIMGHVDHGKTSLLDAIRKTQVAAGEAGGITQHVGAYTVTAPNGLEVTFIDTPGHEAFTEMRARGSQMTDVVVIVVAADDGVMPQTREAINHAKAAGVSIVVAMNKIDKPEATQASQERVIRELAEAGLQAEEWGGEIAVVRTSAVSGQGIDELLERLALETEILELKANHFASASGTVIEAHRTEGQGVTASFLVQRGSLAIGDIILAGVGYGRVRSMTNWKGERSELAGPSTAVEIIGLDEMPRAGDKWQVLEDLKQAAEIADARRQARRERELMAKQKVTTAATLFGDIAASKKKEIKVVVKCDASGSLEVLNKTLSDLATDDFRVTIVHSGVGGITSSDVTLAEASKAMIVGFHVVPDSKARLLADSYGLDVRIYTIIYELLDDVKAAMTGMLDPLTIEKVIGHAEVRQTFTITKVGVVAGLKITDGVTRRDAFMRITREQNIVHTGKVNTLRRFKEDVKEVREGFECGLTIENFQDVRVGDIMEFFVKEKMVQKLK
jgi:translation initiation factor IF-2